MTTRMWKYWCMFCDKYSEEVIISEKEPEDGPLCCSDTRMIAITQVDGDMEE